MGRLDFAGLLFSYWVNGSDWLEQVGWFGGLSRLVRAGDWERAS